jgi:hypothetical protein
MGSHSREQTPIQIDLRFFIGSIIPSEEEKLCAKKTNSLDAKASEVLSLFDAIDVAKELDRHSVTSHKPVWHHDCSSADGLTPHAPLKCTQSVTIRLDDHFAGEAIHQDCFPRSHLTRHIA